MNRGGRVEPTPPECALAAEMFDHFCSAGTMKQILALHREICNTLNLKPTRLPGFYPKLKAKLSSSWKAQALFKKFDARANHKVYGKGRACVQGRVLIIGAGPCGLRAAIECQLLGNKVVVIEKRDRMSRNNVLHLWPFVIQDLRALGAKKFFGKFCAGSIDHISIRQLQCILLKVALLLGVEFHEGVSFEELLEPTITDNSETLGWRARVTPTEHPVAQYEFDVLVGADGKRNTLQGFKRKEFRGKLAMAITANFINRHTEQEASVEEISGVAFIFNQKFFKELYEETGIDLENIVYYKDDTHYFVMTAKKHSLLDKGVLLNDYTEVSRLLSVVNVDRDALMRYAQEAARFSTDGKLPLRDFALNHYGEPDVALFDFTSMYAAENASMVYERHGRRLLCQLVGDSLLEPFWPTGSGCARGFLSAFDAAWAVRAWGQAPHPHPLEVIAERESVYRLLAQTTPENLHRDFGAYTIDPGTRYPNLNRAAVTPHRVTGFYNSDDPLPLDAAPAARKRRRAEAELSDEAILGWVGWSEPGLRAAASPSALGAVLLRYRPDLLCPGQSPRPVHHILHHEFGIAPFSSNGSTQDVPDAKLRSYLARVYTAFKGEVPHVHHQSDVFHQIKQQQKENAPDLSIARYTSAAEAEKTPSNNKKKRRSVRTPHVSNANDPAEYIRKQIGKLDLNDITQLARLIEGHDAIKNDEEHADQQKELQEQILALLDPEDSPDPNMLRSSLSQLLHGSSKTKMKTRERESNLARYFQDGNGEQKVTKPPRRLKGLDADSVKVPDFDIFNDSADTDVTVVNMETKKKDLGKSSPRDTHKKKEFIRSASTESSLPPKGRRMSEITRDLRNRQSESPEVTIVKTRSNSIGAPELVQNTRRIAQLFEGHKRRHTPSPQSRATRSNSAGSVTIPEKVLRWQRMAEIIEGKQRNTPSPERVKRESIGNPEMALRRQKVADLIQGHKPRQSQSPEPVQKKNASEMAFRMQRVSDMMQKRREEAKRPKSGGRRKAAREIMRQRFEKSLQMLAAEPSLEMAPSADLENDYGLQQYRASAPQFEDRVKKLEKKLQHYEEGRIVGGGGRTAGSGARVARLAAELSGTTNTPAAVPKASKPKDLMRSVGKIERDDWNVKEIERKIMENRLGRPEPKTAEKVPKWDREQFLGRQKRLKEGEASDEKWVEIDETLHKLDQKLRDSGRPDHGTRKVANLANKFVKKDEPVPAKTQPKEEIKKGWRGPSSAGMQCAACGTRVFAAEGVTADGLHLHRACFRCAVCKAVLRPGNYTMERYGSRLVCMRHSGTTVPDAATIIASLTAPAQTRAPTTTPERISLEVSDSCAREIDEDEWTDRNFLASETSGAGGLSDDDDSSSDEYTDAGDSVEEEAHSPDLPVPRLHRADVYASDDSFGYDEYSDDGAESSGNESCSRMREAREARRREVPAEARPPTDSSEVESDDESDSSEVSSATEVSTDSEFAKEENAAAPLPPAILVTEATPPAPPPPQDYPLSRTRSAGGLATKRALELKRRYLLGEPSPPAVRKSDSTSQLDTKLEAFRSTITEFQKMLHPAPAPVTSTPLQRPLVAVQFSTEEKRSQPMPDIIQNLCDAPVDLLTKGDSPLCKREWIDGSSEDRKDDKTELETDSLSDDSSHTETAPNQPVPRVEVHDEGGELIQLDSLTIINSTTEENDDKASGTATATGPTVVAAESESSESCRDATTLALTETELSDWAAESAVLDECGLDDRDERKRSKNPRTLSGPKTVHDTKNITAIPSHVCGRTSPTDRVVYSNALEHFEFADEGDQDPSVETPLTPRNEGYMELVNDDYDPYSLGHDRSINFIEGSFETVVKPSQEASISQILEGKVTTNDLKNASEIERSQEEPKSNSEAISDELKSPQLLKSLENISSDKSNSDDTATSDAVIVQLDDTNDKNDPYAKGDLLSLSDTSRSVGENTTEHKSKKDDSQIIKSQDSTSKSNSSNGSLLSTRSSSFKNDVSIEDASPPLVSEPTKSKSKAVNNMNVAICPKHCSIRLYSPAICRSASDTFNRSNSRSTNSPARSMELSINFSSGSGSISSVSMTMKDMTDKVQEIKREREEQTEVVRRLVLERLGNAPKVSRKSTRRMRVSPVGTVPPPVPPPPVSLTPPLPPPPLEEVLPPPRPAPPLVLPVTPSFSDPELARDRRRRSIMKSISNYLNRRLGPRQKESPASMNKSPEAHKSTGALQEAPPVPPPPAGYSLPDHHRQNKPGGRESREPSWSEIRWSQLVDGQDASARRLALLERRLTRPLSAEQQAATVAELVQVTAQRDARRALLAAERRRSGVGN